MNPAAQSTQHSALVLVILNSEALVDSREMAKNLGNKHQNVFELISNYLSDFQQLAKVRFQTGPSPDSKTGQTVKFALLNEDQCYLLLTYSRNSDRVRQLKVRLVKTFRDARRAVDIRRTEYLPEYHALHDEVAKLATGSPNDHHIHSNFNRLANRVVGIAAGQRHNASAPTQALLSVVQTIMVTAMRGSTDHHDGYLRAKQALQSLTAAISGPEASHAT